MNTNRLVLLVPALVLIFVGAARAESWGPWPVGSNGSAIPASPQREVVSEQSPRSDALVSAPFTWLLKFYQNVISPVDGDRCSMYPTCSQFSMQAIRKHGPVMGIIMTSDRLMHELDEQRISRILKVGNRYRVLDTVENNDFWWDNQ